MPRDDLAHLYTERLWLRRVVEDDWELQRALDTDVRVMATLGGLRSEDFTETYLRRHVDHWAEHGFGLWTIFDRVAGGFVGRGGLRHITLDDGYSSVEVGYALVPGAWGRGLATEIATTAMTAGREVLGLREIIGVTLPTNRASQRVLEKAGLDFVGDTSYRGFPQVLYRWAPLDVGGPGREG